LNAGLASSCFHNTILLEALSALSSVGPEGNMAKCEEAQVSGPWIFDTSMLGSSLDLVNMGLEFHNGNTRCMVRAAIVVT